MGRQIHLPDSAELLKHCRRTALRIARRLLEQKPSVDTNPATCIPQDGGLLLKISRVGIVTHDRNRS